MRFKFSLRSALLLLTVGTIFFGWRYNQRNELLMAARQINEMGGEVFYRWQSPSLVSLPAAVPNIHWTVSVPYEETNPDGSKVTKTRVEISGRNPGYTVATDVFRATNSTQPTFGIAGFLIGSHDDVALAAASVPAASVNEDNVEYLRCLEEIILLLDPRYFSFEASTRITEEERERELEQFGKDLSRASNIIKRQCKDAILHRRGMK